MKDNYLCVAIFEKSLYNKLLRDKFKACLKKHIKAVNYGNSTNGSMYANDVDTDKYVTFFADYENVAMAVDNYAEELNELYESEMVKQQEVFDDKRITGNSNKRKKTSSSGAKEEDKKTPSAHADSESTEEETPLSLLTRVRSSWLKYLMSIIT